MELSKASWISLIIVVLQPLAFGQGVELPLCPSECHCFLNELGRKEVACTKGEMQEIPTHRISPSTEVIRIEPGRTPSNSITMGRYFDHLDNLKELHIVNSKIPNIGEHTFTGMDQLRVMNLSRNDIRFIVEANFEGLSGLEVLDLSNSNIESFVSACFSQLVELRSLNLSWNKAPIVAERLFYHLNKLEILDLSGNPLHELGSNPFVDIQNLTHLYCRQCGLKTVDPLVFEFVPNLQVLDLGNNELKRFIREDPFTLLQIKKLSLDGNELSAITDYTFGYLHLESLNLASNRIVRFDRNSFVNSSIQALDLSDNNFKTIDVEIFMSLKPNLTMLNLSRNPRFKPASLSKLLSDHPQLVSLSLQENKYDHLPLDIFDNMHALEYLNLSRNHLRRVEFEHVSSLSALWVLDLSNNRLVGIDEHVFKFFDRLFHFDDLRLDGNSWACDLCNIPGLLNWVQSGLHPMGHCGGIEGHDCLRCSSPPALIDQPLISLNESTLDWCETTDSESEEDEGSFEDGSEEVTLAPVPVPKAGEPKNNSTDESKPVPPLKPATTNPAFAAFMLVLIVTGFGVTVCIWVVYISKQIWDERKRQHRPEREEGPQIEHTTSV